jgi:hypothetical protein
MIRPIHPFQPNPALKNKQIFNLARSLHCMLGGPIKGPHTGRIKMFAHDLDARQIAVSFAGALISALLFVSAAVGPLPIV